MRSKSLMILAVFTLALTGCGTDSSSSQQSLEQSMETAPGMSAVSTAETTGGNAGAPGLSTETVPGSTAPSPAASAQEGVVTSEAFPGAASPSPSGTGGSSANARSISQAELPQEFITCLQAAGNGDSAAFQQALGTGYDPEDFGELSRGFQNIGGYNGQLKRICRLDEPGETAYVAEAWGTTGFATVRYQIEGRQKEIELCGINDSAFSDYESLIVSALQAAANNNRADYEKAVNADVLYAVQNQPADERNRQMISDTIDWSLQKLNLLFQGQFDGNIYCIEGFQPNRSANIAAGGKVYGKFDFTVAGANGYLEDVEGMVYELNGEKGVLFEFDDYNDYDDYDDYDD